MGVLKDKTIVVGVCGGIAAYKAAELVRLLTAQQARVRVMMSRNAAEFITPLTMQTLSANPVATDTFNLTEESEIGHIRLADTADAIVIAPASADVIAKAAVGIADEIVTTVLLAAQCPIAFAPAMNVHMYAHPTVVENLARLSARGVTVIEPASGDLACGYQGKGRLPDPAAIVEEVERMLSPHDLAAERILVTAGPTQEMIDPVRFVSNRSTGKMGFAIARAAWRRGAIVRLIAGPSPLGTPYGAERIDTVSAAEMLNAPDASGAAQDQEECARDDARDGGNCGRDAAAQRAQRLSYSDRLRGRDPGAGGKRCRQAAAQTPRPHRRQRRVAQRRRLRRRHQYRDHHRRGRPRR
jgi:phosphopantothenoylcysteine decarboxylase/phosphopantothenate--cysteine ligase